MVKFDFRKKLFLDCIRDAGKEACLYDRDYDGGGYLNLYEKDLVFYGLRLLRSQVERLRKNDYKRYKFILELLNDLERENRNFFPKIDYVYYNLKKNFEYLFIYNKY